MRLLRSAAAAAGICALVLAGCGDTSSVPGGGRVEHFDSGRKLTWPAPKLRDPKTVTLRDGKNDLRLDPKRDYVLKLPGNRPLRAEGGLRIYGGHNVVLVGGTVDVTDASPGVLLHAQTGTMHVEGVRFTGKRLTEGIDLDEGEGATVQLQNIYVDTVHGSYETNHADLMQAWAGPRKLLVDGFYGKTQYQGFFLLPEQHTDGPPPRLFDLRNVHIVAPTGGYALWRSPSNFPLRTSNVTVRPNLKKGGPDQWLWPKPSSGDPSWKSVRVGAPGRLAKRALSAGQSYP
jgi:hypothetical protein